MATKADFTEDEWKTLHKGVTGAGLLVSVGDRDFTDTFGEAGALAKRLREEHEKSESELVRELAEARGSGLGFTAARRRRVGRRRQGRRQTRRDRGAREDQGGARRGVRPRTTRYAPFSG